MERATFYADLPSSLTHALAGHYVRENVVPSMLLLAPNTYQRTVEAILSHYKGAAFLPRADFSPLKIAHPSGRGYVTLRMVQDTEWPEHIALALDRRPQDGYTYSYTLPLWLPDEPVPVSSTSTSASGEKREKKEGGA